jgi:hypothetical protein
MIRNKHYEDKKKGPLMMCHNDMNTSRKKKVKTRVKTTISFYGKENEIVFVLIFQIFESNFIPLAIEIKMCMIEM